MSFQTRCLFLHIFLHAFIFSSFLCMGLCISIPFLFVVVNYSYAVISKACYIVGRKRFKLVLTCCRDKTDFKYTLLDLTSLDLALRIYVLLSSHYDIE